MPNRIFLDLVEHIDVDKEKRQCEHIAFAYCYVYLISYLYRYAIHGRSYFDEEILRKILQTAPKYKRKNYITKKGGILDQQKYIKKDKEVPIGYHYQGNYENEPEFVYHSEYKWNPEQKYAPNYYINYPFKAFNEDDDDDESKPFNYGYFYNIANTHLIPVDIFIFCMSKEDLGTCGFYLYSFIKQKCDIFKEGWNCKFTELIKLTGLKKDKLNETLKALESYNMIFNSHEDFYVNLHKSSHKPELHACTYKAKPFNKFSEVKKEVFRGEIIYLEDETKYEARDLENDKL